MKKIILIILLFCTAAYAANFYGDINIKDGNLNIEAQKELRLQDTAGGEYMGLKAPASVTSSTTLTLPDGDGTSGQVLSTNGAGVLSWADDASSTVSVTSASYHSTVQQAVTNTSTSIIDYETSEFDDESTVTTGASWKFTANKTAKFLVSGSACISFGTLGSTGRATNATLALYKNNVLYKYLETWTSQSSTPKSITLHGTKAISLALNDYIDIRLANNLGVSVNVNDNSFCNDDTNISISEILGD